MEAFGLAAAPKGIEDQISGDLVDDSVKMTLAFRGRDKQDPKVYADRVARRLCVRAIAEANAHTRPRIVEVEHEARQANIRSSKRRALSSAGRRSLSQA